MAPIDHRWDCHPQDRVIVRDNGGVGPTHIDRTVAKRLDSRVSVQ
jgi:hypothetical protein